MKKRRGVLLVELLVVLLIILVAFGLILAGVQRLRETARAMQCANNLKQITLATQEYARTYNRLPHLVDQGDGAPTGRGLPSPFAEIVPFIEATFLGFRPEQSADYYHAHSSVTLDYVCKGEPNKFSGGFANLSTRLFIDPADDTAYQLHDVPMTLPDGSTGYYATGSYAANGQAPWGKKCSRDFLNSSSNLILFSERPQVCVNSAGETIYNLWGVGFYSPHMPAFAALTPDDPPGLWSTGQIAPASLPDENAADRDALIRVRIGRQSAEPTAPDFRTPLQRVRPGQACDPRLPGTPHRRGLQAAMADGSVRIFAPDTSPWVFWSACTPARKAGEE